jgi:PAS domain S-box-containing protein
VSKGERKKYHVKESAEFKWPQSSTIGSEEWVRGCPVSLAQVLNSLPFPFYVIDASNYIIKSANPSAQFGRLSSTSTCYALTHKWDKPCGSAAHPCPLAKVRKTRKPVTVEHVHFDKGGKPRNVEVHAFPVFDATGKVSYMIEYVLDITMRKRAEDALRESEQKFRKLFEDALTGNSITTGDGIILDCNPAFSRMFGYKNKVEAVGESVTVLHPEPSELGSILDKVRAKGKLENYETIRKRKDGSLIDVIENVVGSFDEGGQLIEVKSYIYDITDRKRAEDALQEAHDELERRVDQRTAELLKSYKEQAFIRETFGTYLSDEVVAEILAFPDRVKLGGEMRDMTILVSDLRGFTGITEAMEASQIVTIINRYLDKMVPIIRRHEGTIDEFTGDGILVFFGAPRRLPDHPSRAVVCALEMQGSMKELNEENLRLGLPQVEMGIAISCGQLAVGNIGSEQRRKYGAVGSSINVAFRLVEKARPGEIVVTQALKDRLDDKLQTGSGWKESLKGIGNTFIYKVIGMKDELEAKPGWNPVHAQN